MSPSRAAAASYPDLAGVTTITTATSGVATVQLLQPARVGFGFGFGAGPGMQDGPAGTGVEGSGRIIGMVLEQNGRAVLEAFRLNDCATAGCDGMGSFGFVDVFTKHGQLSPGVYHLYVVTDGKPVRATLSLTGLAGTTSIDVAPSTDIVEQSLTPMAPSTGVVDPPAYSAGGSGAIGAAGGLMLDALVLQMASFEGGYFGSCGGQGAPPPAYVAGCTYPPDGSTVSNLASPFLICDPTGFCDPGFTVDAATQPGEFFGGGEMPVEPGQAGTWSQGGYFDGAAVLTGEAATGVWLPFVASTSATGPETSSSSPSSPSPAPSPSATPAPVASVAAPRLPNTSGPGSAVGGASAMVLLGLGGVAALRRRRVSGA